MEESNIEYFAEPADEAATKALCELFAIRDANALRVEITLNNSVRKALRITREQFVRLIAQLGPPISCNLLVGCKDGPLISANLQPIRGTETVFRPDYKVLNRMFSEIVELHQMVFMPVKFNLPEKKRRSQRVRPVRERKP